MLCLVGREFCLYAEINATRVPLRQRQEFIAMSVRRTAPYQDPKFGLAWLGDHAAVWYWSHAKVLEQLGSQWSHRTICAPEALYTGQVHQDAEEVLALDEGFEGRLWKHGRLQASRWWATAPTPAQWQAFLRGTGITTTAEAQPPESTTAAPATQRWTPAARSTRINLSGLESYLPRLLLALALATALLFSWQTGTLMRSGIDIWRTQQAAQDLDEPLKHILAARDRADAANVEIASLLALRQAPSQYRLLAEVARVMQGQDWRLKNWQQPTPDRIEAILIVDSPDPEALVTAWESSPLFSDVRTDLSRQQNEITVRATVAAGREAAQ